MKKKSNVMKKKNIFTTVWQVIALLQHLIIELFNLKNRFLNLSTRYYN